MASAASTARPRGGKVKIGIIIDGKVDEIIDHRLGTRLKREGIERAIIIGDHLDPRDDIVVGTTWEECCRLPPKPPKPPETKEGR